MLEKIEIGEGEHESDSPLFELLLLLIVLYLAQP